AAATTTTPPLGATTTTTIAPAPCGDVNGDRVVNIGDALVVSQFDVGLRPCSELTHPEACDVNGDGACNIGDALKMAQCDVGLTSCAFRRALCLPVRISALGGSAREQSPPSGPDRKSTRLNS